MKEAEARDLLRQYDGVGGLEVWIAGRQWQAVPGGWTVPAELQGWRFRLELVAEGVRIEASMPGGNPAVWVVR